MGSCCEVGCDAGFELGNHDHAKHHYPDRDVGATADEYSTLFHVIKHNFRPEGSRGEMAIIYQIKVVSDTGAECRSYLSFSFVASYTLIAS